MDDKERERIQDFIDENSMESIVQVYTDVNCYQPLVQIIMDMFSERLSKLNAIEKIVKEE